MRLGFFTVLLWLASLAAAQGRAGASAWRVPANTIPDSLRKTRLDSLLLAECPGHEQVRVAKVLFGGNEVTKEHILRAELDFREGDTLPVATLAQRLEENRLRLFNLRLFNRVYVQTTCRDGALIVLFGVQERWYTFPVPIFSLADRNFRSWLDRPDRWRRLDYGMHLVRYNFRGRNEELRGNLQLGFNRKYELFYLTPSLHRGSRLGLSLGASLYQSRTVDYDTRSDRLLALRTDRGYATERWYATGGLRWRRTVQRLTTLEAFYVQERVTDSVRQYNPAYFLGRNRRAYAELVLARTLNLRNTFAYPLTGSYLQLSAAQRFFLSSASPPVTTLSGQYARYYELGRGFYYSIGTEARLRLARRLAYSDSHALGFRQALVRGYDAYVVDGRHYGVVRQGVSLRVLDAGRLRLPVLTDPRLSRIPLLVYLNTFADAGYVAERTVPATNKLTNRMLASAGIGLHLVTYYDRVLTIEYARTLEGFGGFFFRTEFPI